MHICSNAAQLCQHVHILTKKSMLAGSGWPVAMNQFSLNVPSVGDVRATARTTADLQSHERVLPDACCSWDWNDMCAAAD